MPRPAPAAGGTAFPTDWASLTKLRTLALLRVFHTQLPPAALLPPALEELDITGCFKDPPYTCKAPVTGACLPRASQDVLA